MMGQQVAFIGLGVMGYPMAGHLAKAGYDVAVFNRTPAKSERWIAQHPGRMATTPVAAAEGAAVVFTCVGDDDDLRQVTLNADGVLQGMQAKAILVDHTTASAEVAREIDGITRQRGIGFIDAPVSGGQAGAEQGILTVMAGADEPVFKQARPLIETYARSVRRLGPVGSGQLTKMVNQLCIAGVLQGLAEGLHFAKAAGLDGEAVLDVIGKGAAQSWQMDNRGKTMLEGYFDFGFAVDWMRKDLAIALAEARRNGARLPVAALIDQLYAEVQALGGGRWDTSSLIARLEAARPQGEK